jgi:hypothetical protein
MLFADKMDVLFDFEIILLKWEKVRLSISFHFLISGLCNLTEKISPTTPSLNNEYGHAHKHCSLHDFLSRGVRLRA